MFSSTPYFALIVYKKQIKFALSNLLSNVESVHILDMFERSNKRKKLLIVIYNNQSSQKNYKSLKYYGSALLNNTSQKTRYIIKIDHIHKEIIKRVEISCSCFSFIHSITIVLFKIVLHIQIKIVATIKIIIDKIKS